MIDLQSLIEYCTQKPGAEETYPFGDHAVWFKVQGKAFAWAFVKEAKVDGEVLPPLSFVNLKCVPERIEELRAQHPAVRPGWHQNKKHWNSVFLDGSIPDDLLYDFIDHSYDVVRSGLSRKQQEQLERQVS